MLQAVGACQSGNDAAIRNTPGAPRDEIGRVAISIILG
jgi:hypothetical protein